MNIPTPRNDDSERLSRVVDALLIGDDRMAESNLPPLQAGLRRNTPHHSYRPSPEAAGRLGLGH
jgi:hypothetical protein